MKDAFYFSHDANARNDPKICAMRSVYGGEGYGWYWMIVEILRDQPNYQLEITKYTFQALAMQMQCDVSTLEKYMDDCISEFTENGVGLFQSDDRYLWSKSLISRMQVVDQKREKAKAAATSRWEKHNQHADAMQTQSECNASKVKNSKRKEKYKYSSSQMLLAEKLCSLILNNNSNTKVPPAMDAWANEIRLMVENDQRGETDIEAVIIWCQQEDFWKTNILSMKKLREKYDTLFLQMNRHQSQGSEQRGKSIFETNKGDRHSNRAFVEYDQ